MALIKCPECGREISDLAKVCVHCGCPIHKVEPKPSSGTIGFRGNQNGSSYWIIMCLVGIFFIVIGSLMLRLTMLRIFPIIVLIGGIALVVECLYYFTIIIVNYHNKNDCVIYNEESDQLIVTTLYGSTYTINRKDFISIKANFSSSFLVKFTYRQSDGSRNTLNLGYCSDREYLVKKMNALRE